MDLAVMWEGVKSSLGLDDAHAAVTVTKAIQILVVALLTLWLGHWASAWIRRAAKAGRMYAEVAVLLGRAAALGIYALGTTVILAALGASWTAIAAILGAATFGISLALQDVGRSFVDGIYILIERPFRIGDQVRIGPAEGRVEEVGVRLTTLRSSAGTRLIVPNTVVFASVIENSSVGQVDRQKYTVSGIERSVDEIEKAVQESLRGLPHLSQRPPIVDIIQSSTEGSTIQVTVEHDLGHRIDDRVIAQLRALFSESTVSTQAVAVTS